ncbi:MAG: HEPN domain-containing protein [Chloroflexia bacterium]|nr:HEPN domain-containing protein [Chloroflexia bacterium]
MNDQPRRPIETPAEWFRYADENLRVAQREMGEEVPAYHTICFLCQSAAEKFLKGYLIAQGWPLERTHDIVMLLGLAATHDTAWQTFVEEGAALNEFVVAGRYPGDLAFDSIGETEAKEALHAAQRIRDKVRQLLR